MQKGETTTGSRKTPLRQLPSTPQRAIQRTIYPEETKSISGERHIKSLGDIQSTYFMV